MDMPNVKPPTVTLGLLDEKFERAAETSVTNYSFYFGATNENAAEIERIDPKWVCGVKVFMGSSTGNMLVDDDRALASIFAQSRCRWRRTARTRRPCALIWSVSGPGTAMR